MVTKIYNYIETMHIMIKLEKIHKYITYIKD